MATGTEECERRTLMRPPRAPKQAERNGGSSALAGREAGSLEVDMSGSGIGDCSGAGLPKEATFYHGPEAMLQRGEGLPDRTFGVPAIP